jgi:hypothetical protein
VSASGVRAGLRASLLVAGFAALMVAPFVVPQGRSRTARDPLAAAVLHLTAVEPGMRRSVLESHLHQVTRHSDGSEVFCHPDSDFLRLDVRLDGPGPDATVIAVGDPYLAHYPTPRHLSP